MGNHQLSFSSSLFHTILSPSAHHSSTSYRIDLNSFRSCHGYSSDTPFSLAHGSTDSSALKNTQCKFRHPKESKQSGILSTVSDSSTQWQLQRSPHQRRPLRPSPTAHQQKSRQQSKQRLLALQSMALTLPPQHPLPQTFRHLLHPESTSIH